MNSRSPGALEVRIDVFLKQIFSSVFRRNTTACVGHDSKEIVKRPFSESVNFQVLS